MLINRLKNWLREKSFAKIFKTNTSLMRSIVAKTQKGLLYSLFLLTSVSNVLRISRSKNVFRKPIISTLVGQLSVVSYLLAL